MTDDTQDRDPRKHPIQKSRRRTSWSGRAEGSGHTPRRGSKHRRDGHDRHSAERRETEEIPSTQNKPVAVRFEEDTEQSFFVDRKGDSQNVVYGGNHNAAIPTYHKWGYGAVIGADRRYRLSSDGSKASESGFTLDGASRGHKKSLLNFRDDPKLGIEQVRADSIHSSNDGIKHQHSYVSVNPNKVKRRTGGAADAETGCALDIITGRSRDSRRSSDSHGIGHDGSDTDASTSTGEEPDAYESFRVDVHRTRSIELTRATIEHPENVDAWLALIAHQDQMFDLDNAASTKTLPATVKRNLAEIKLALYEKALKKVTDSMSRDRLIIGLMYQGTFIWDTETFSRKWRAVLKEESSAGLWIRYLNFRQTSSTTFNYEDCLSVHGDCLKKALLKNESLIRDELGIYVLLRTTVFMTRSGYLERATAIWQSLLEFSFFRPEQLDATWEQSSFQAFWESETARIGESGASGWALSRSIEASSRSDSVPDNASSDDIYEAWALREIEAATSCVMPARTLDDVTEDDPFRVILYSDITEYLFRPSTAAGGGMLINAFLKFCELPAIYYPGSETRCMWWTDAFLSSRAHQIAGTVVSDTKTLFPLDTVQSVFPPGGCEDGEARIGFRRRVLKQLTMAVTDDDRLAEYVVAFEASLDLKEARRLAKALLKSRPSSLRLYNAYALLECRLDRFESAEHVWSTATSMCQDVSTVELQDLALVWCSWVWECLRQGNLSRAQKILLCIPFGHVAPDLGANETFSTTAARLRTKNHLESLLSQQMSLRQEGAIAYYIELLAVLEYLTESQSISAALGVYSMGIGILVKISASPQLIEVLHQSRAQLLHIHPTLSPRGYRPAEINRQLAESLRTIPSNSMFHQLYQEHTRRTGLFDRVRDGVSTSSSSHKGDDQDASIIPLIFAIEAEMSRPHYAGSTNHSIQAAFERAVAAAKACVGIWVRYVRWEVGLQQTMPALETSKPRGEKNRKDIPLQRNRAVDVYYRSIRACPWAKELYMLAYSEAPLRMAIGAAELRKIYDVMMEKGLRLHVEIDA